MAPSTALDTAVTADDAPLTVTRVELVRATATTSLLRVDLEGAVDLTAGALLVVRGVGLPRRLTPLPTQGDAPGHVRLAFAVPSELRDGRFALQLAERELSLAAPPERTREDAIAAVQLQKMRDRLTMLEAELAERATGETPAAPLDDEHRRRLEEQLAQHRHMRAELSRELESIRARASEAQDALDQERELRERIEQELALEQSQRADDEARLSETIEAARARVEYLERRLVEVQARTRGA